MAKTKIHNFRLLILIGLLLLVKCDNTDRFEFPYVYMNVVINVYSDAEFARLSTPSSSMIITKHPNGYSTLGYDNNGIIVYNTGMSGEAFYAFDRTCPYDLPNSVALELDGGVATCPVCNSIFLLPSEGLPAQGSASKYYLKKYRTTFYANGDLYIYN